MKALLKSQPIAPGVGLLLLRLVVGFVFFYHGGQKLFGMFGGKGMDATINAFTKMGLPLPTVSAWLAGIAEFGGGILLMLGIATGLASLALAFTMAVAIWTAHRSSFGLPSGMEYALTLGVASLTILFAGPGTMALGRRP